jgi:hypothetical protein
MLQSLGEEIPRPHREQYPGRVAATEALPSGFSEDNIRIDATKAKPRRGKLIGEHQAISRGRMRLKTEAIC